MSKGVVREMKILGGKIKIFSREWFMAFIRLYIFCKVMLLFAKYGYAGNSFYFTNKNGTRCISITESTIKENGYWLLDEMGNDG